jgi:hypothetical protein
METMIDLIADQKKDIKRLKSLMTYQRAQEFISKRNENIKKDQNKFMLLDDADYNNDSIPDIVVTKGGKEYSFNGFLTKDTNFPLQKRFAGTYKDKYNTERTNKQGEAIMMYPKYKKSSIVSPAFNSIPSHPRHIKWNLNTTYDPATVNQYPSVQKYYSKVNNLKDSTAYSVITEEVIKPLWLGCKQFAIDGKDQGYMDITSDVSYITLKNKALHAIIRNDLRLEIHGFDDLKPSKKTECANDYFDRVTSQNLVNAVQRAFNVLTGIKENILKQQTDQQTIDYYLVKVQSMLHN